jgi:hypothetical protein
VAAVHLRALREQRTGEIADRRTLLLRDHPRPDGQLSWAEHDLLLQRRRIMSCVRRW